MNYPELLKNPRWQKKRLEILQRDDWTCIGCGATDKELHVHHFMYEKGKYPWQVDSELLGTLCSDCHQLEHTKRGAINEVLVDVFAMKRIPVKVADQILRKIFDMTRDEFLNKMYDGQEIHGHIKI